ncbi:hypothetical protein HAX54_020328, partial [Datura stramonium]|nr:hypothetical protein [Datura stramonium]
LTAWLTAHHGPEGASDGHQRCGGPSVESLKENFFDSRVTIDLTDYHRQDVLTLVPSKGDCGRLYWFRETTQMIDRWECDGPSRLASGCLVVEILLNSQEQFCNLPCFLTLILHNFKL